jgi:hypothetical protein
MVNIMVLVVLLPGFGPYIYELMMMLLNIKGKGLMPNREGDKEDCVKCGLNSILEMMKKKLSNH